MYVCTYVRDSVSCSVILDMVKLFKIHSNNTLPVCVQCARASLSFHWYCVCVQLVRFSTQSLGCVPPRGSRGFLNSFQVDYKTYAGEVPSSDFEDVGHFSLAAWVQDRCEIMRQDTSWQAAVTSSHSQVDINASFQELLENVKYAPMNSSFDLVKLIAPFRAWDASNRAARWFKQTHTRKKCVFHEQTLEHRMMEIYLPPNRLKVQNTCFVTGVMCSDTCEIQRCTWNVILNSLSHV